MTLPSELWRWSVVPAPESSWFSFPNRFWQQTDKDILVQQNLRVQHTLIRTVSPAGLSRSGTRRGYLHQSSLSTGSLACSLISCFGNCLYLKAHGGGSRISERWSEKMSGNNRNLYEDGWRQTAWTVVRGAGVTAGWCGVTAHTWGHRSIKQPSDHHLPRPLDSECVWQFRLKENVWTRTKSFC